MEAWIRELEKAKGPEVIDVDATVENTMVVFLAIEELRKDTEEGWKKLVVPLDQVIEANNASNVGLKKRDVQLVHREDIMDRRVCANQVKIDELVTNLHFSRSFRLIFLNTYSHYLSRSQLNNLTMFVSNHFAYSLCSQITRKHVY